MNQNLTIGWLYPELMSTYGDHGNIIALSRRCQWRGIEVEIKELNVGFDPKQLAICNLLFMGGAQDQQQKIVAFDLEKKKKVLIKMIENNIPGLFICGAYQFLGKYYKEADGTIVNGLNIFDLHTENPGPNHPRLIGDMVFDADSILRTADSTKTSSHQPLAISNYIVGFENHGGRTYLGKNAKPFGKVIKGFGNNGKDGTEGAIYKNSFGTYSHGPILPKNPEFADYLISVALEKKYGRKISLSHLDDTLSEKAREVVVKRLY